MGLIVFCIADAGQPRAVDRRAVRVRRHRVRTVRRVHGRRAAVDAGHVCDGGGRRPCSPRAWVSWCRRLRGRVREECASSSRCSGSGRSSICAAWRLAVRLNSIATVAKLLPLLMVAIGGAFFVDSRQAADRRDASRRRCRAHVAPADFRVCRHRVRARAERRSARHGAHRTARDRPRHDRASRRCTSCLQVVAQGILGSALATSSGVTRLPMRPARRSADGRDRSCWWARRCRCSAISEA